MWFIIPIPREAFSSLGVGLGCLTLSGFLALILAITALTFLWPLVLILMVVALLKHQRDRNVIAWKLKEAELAASRANGFLEVAQRAAQDGKSDARHAGYHLATAETARAAAEAEAFQAEEAAQEARSIAARGFVWNTEPLLNRVNAATQSARSAAAGAQRPVFSASVSAATAGARVSLGNGANSIRTAISRFRRRQ